MVLNRFSCATYLICFHRFCIRLMVRNTLILLLIEAEAYFGDRRGGNTRCWQPVVGNPLWQTIGSNPMCTFQCGRPLWPMSEGKCVGPYGDGRYSVDSKIGPENDQSIS